MSESSKGTNREASTGFVSQRGVVIPIVAIGLLALLAVAGLALDASHALANKTRMQNTVDAAALAAAKVLDLTENTALAETAAVNIFGDNALGAGNHELNDAMGEITIDVQFSATVNPFTEGSPDGPFVRVIATGFDTQTTLSRVLGIDDIPTPATAVAGPSGPLGTGPGSEICGVTPIAVCPPRDPDDPSETLPFSVDDFHVLKPTGGNHDDIGPGNYKMLRLKDEDGNAPCGGACLLRKNLAGEFKGCAIHSDFVETEPGVDAGPTSQGFNTRFNEHPTGHLNPTDHPPDKVITGQEQGRLRACWDDITNPEYPVDRIYQPSAGKKNYCKDYDPDEAPWKDEEIFNVEKNDETVFTYQDYMDDLKIGPTIAGGKEFRRVLVFPQVNCDGSQTGQSSLFVTGFACFFMLQPLDTGNIGQGGGQIFGQYIGECNAKGTGSATPDPGPGPLLYKIQLYKNSASVDS